MLVLLLLIISNYPMNFLLVLWLWWTGMATALLPQSRPTPCDVFGQIYVEKDPYLATFRVFVEKNNEFNADVVVFEENNALFADKPGFWYFTDKRGFANYSIAYVQDRNVADFVIYFTNRELYAGCNKR
jgi:hypothetical protein